MRAAVFAAAFALSFVGSAVAEVRSVRLYPERSFGFFVGDVVKARLEIVADETLRLQSASLPLPGPLAYWLDLRDVHAEEEKAGDGSSRWRIELSYQIFYVALDVRDLEIPAFSLRFSSGAGVETIRAPAWKIGVSPLREVLPQRRDDPTEYMRPDSAAAFVDAGKPAIWAGSLLASTVAALVAVARDRGWPPFHRRRARVFATAARRVAALAHAGGEDARRDALLALHRAIDASAGCRVFAEDLDDFLFRRVEFAGSRSTLEAFFAASRKVFFGAGGDADLPLTEIASLARRLADDERRSAA